MDSHLIAFECLWDEVADDYSKEYGISLLDPELLPLIEEAEAIWKRWSTAFHAGKTSIDTHPALSADRNRRDQLRSILDKNYILTKTSANEPTPNSDLRP